MSRIRISILASLFALVLSVALTQQSHAQVSTETIPKFLYSDSYFGTTTNPSNMQAYFYGIVTALGDAPYLATSNDQYFGYVTALKFGSGYVTFSMDGFNNTGSGYFTGTIQATSTGTMTVLLKDYFSGATIYSAVLKKTPGFTYFLK